MAHDVGGECRMPRIGCRRGAFLGRDVRHAGQRLDAVGLEVATGQHGEHARHAGGAGDVDRPDPGMGVRRAQHGGMRLAGQVDVLEIAAATGEQPQILGAGNRLTNAELHRGCSFWASLPHP
jgi:hypothetical protein